MRYFKLGISALLLWLVFRQVDTDKLRNTLLHLSLPAMALLFTGYFIGQCLSTLKWLLLARSGGIKASYPEAWRAYFIGMFFNNLGLGTVGGDLARALLLGRKSSSRAIALASVLADRIHGLIVLFLIGIVAVTINRSSSVDSSLISTLGTLTAVAIIGWWAAPPLVLGVLKRIRHPMVVKLHGRLSQALGVFPRNPITVLQVTLISLTFHFLQISLHLVMAWAVFAHVGLSKLLTTIPFVNILSSLPLSWNGLGVREKSYAYFLSPEILSSDQVIAFGAMWLLAVTVSSAIGGVIALFTDDFAYLKTARLERTEAVPPVTASGLVDGL